MKQRLLLMAIAILGAFTTSFAQVPTLADSQLDQNLLPVPQIQFNARPGMHKESHGYNTPEGEAKNYTMTYKLMGSTELNSVVKVIFSEDGKYVYIDRLFPYTLKEEWGAWTKGEIQEDGKTIKIPFQDIYSYDYYGDGSIVYEMWAGKYDTSTGELTDAYMEISNDTIKQQNLDDYFYLAGYLNESLAGAFCYQTSTSLVPGGEAPQVVECPEGVEQQDYIYTYKNSQAADQILKGKVAFDGNDVYFLGLVPKANAWVKGTLEGDTVTIKDGQYLGNSLGYELYLRFLTATFEYKDVNWDTHECKFVYNKDDESLRLVEDERLCFIALATSSDKIYTYDFTFKLTKYNGPQGAVPADPYGLKTIANDSKTYLYFANTLLNADGVYFEPSMLYVRGYLDGEIYTFTADEYAALDEDTELIPWNLYDGVDFYGFDTYHYLQFHEALYETLGAQIVYVFDGKSYYSNIVKIDADGNVSTDYVDEEGVATGINEVNANVNSNCIYNIAGQRVSNAQKGIFIQNGKKFVVK